MISDELDSVFLYILTDQFIASCQAFKEHFISISSSIERLFIFQNMIPDGLFFSERNLNIMSGKILKILWLKEEEDAFFLACKPEGPCP